MAAAQKADQQTGAVARKNAERKKLIQIRRDFEAKAKQKNIRQRAADRRKAEEIKRLERIERERKDEQRKADQLKQAEQRKAEALTRKAEAYVIERFRQHQADQIAEHRRQTDRMRTQHREEMKSLRSGQDDAVSRHWHAVRRIDDAEARSLADFDTRRRSLAGRAVEMVRGKAHFEAARAGVQQQFEQQRMAKHRDLEALKERQFKAAQDTRLRQAQERKAIFDAHRQGRADLQRQQDRDRPRMVEDRQHAITRAAAIEKANIRSQAQERAGGISDTFRRGL